MSPQSKYDPRYAILAERLCRLFGATDQQLADTLDVSRSAIMEWRLAYPEFAEAVKAGKAYADEQVEQALFKRAVGAVVKDTKFFSYEHESWKEEYDKHLPPDTLACIYWLNNRKPDQWKQRQTAELEVVKPIPLSYALPDSAPEHPHLKIVGHVIDVSPQPSKAVDE